jgi:hypothetical protein
MSLPWSKPPRLPQDRSQRKVDVLVDPVNGESMASLVVDLYAALACASLNINSLSPTK